MSIFQQIPSGFEIFGCLSDFILNRITNNSSSNIFFNTGMLQSNRVREVGKLPVVPLNNCFQKKSKVTKAEQFKKYLFVGVNKQELIDFLSGDWSTHPKQYQLLRSKTIYFKTRKDAFKLNLIRENTSQSAVIQSRRSLRKSLFGVKVSTRDQVLLMLSFIKWIVMQLSCQCITLGYQQ